MKTNKVILGIISGMAIGAVLGVLFAPDKGANTRKKLLKKGVIWKKVLNLNWII